MQYNFIHKYFPYRFYYNKSFMKLKANSAKRFIFLRNYSIIKLSNHIRKLAEETEHGFLGGK